MKAAALAVLGLTLAFGACTSADEARDTMPPSAGRDAGGREATICISGRERDTKYFRELLLQVGVRDIPHCLPTLETDVVATVTRYAADDRSTHLVRIRFTLDRKEAGRMRRLLDLSSTGEGKKGENDDQTVARIVKHDRGLYLDKLDATQF